MALGYTSLAAEAYDPVVNPEELATMIDSPFLGMAVGKKLMHEARMT